MIPDVLDAVVTMLRADSEVAALLGTRIYVAELPKFEADDMPRDVAVLRLSPGGLGDIGASFLNAARTHFDLFAYGSSPKAAMVVYRTIAPVLKQARAQVQVGTLILSVTPTMSPAQLRDPDTDWPFVLAGYNVFAAELTAT